MRTKELLQILQFIILISLGFMIHEFFISVSIGFIALSAIDQETALQIQNDPIKNFTYSQSKRNVTITTTLERACKSILLHIVANVDTDASIAPARSEDSPFDLISQIQIQGGATDMELKPWVLKPLAVAYERQDISREDEPSVATNQTDDEFGFTIMIPAPMPKDAKVQVDITFRSDADLDASGAGKYSNHDGTGYIVFIGTESDPPPLKTYYKRDNGTEDIDIDFPQNVEAYWLIIANEDASPATPTAGNDEVKYEDTFTDLEWITNSGNSQFARIPLFEILAYYTAYRFNVTKLTGRAVFEPAKPILLGANNKILAVANGTDTVLRACIFGTPPSKDTK